MRKLTAFISVFVVLVVSSCGKNEKASVRAMDPDAPEWLYDETSPVPIGFGVGTVVSATTKSDYSVEPEGYFTSDSFRYGVLALDQNGDVHPSVNGVEARNVPTSLIMDGIAGYKTQFVGELDVNGVEIEKTHYYPVKSDKNYTFYAYHITNLLRQVYTPDSDNKIGSIGLGDCDIVYAKAEAVEFQGHAGYNAAYIRALMDYGGAYHYYYLDNSFAPHFQFEHLTSRFRFWVQAVDEVSGGAYAEETMDGKVKVTGIKVSNVKKSATLDIMTGSLSGEVNPSDNEFVVNRDAISPFYPKKEGGFWGDPLFVLPNDILTEPGYVMTLTIEYLNPSTADGGGEWKTAEYTLPLVNKKVVNEVMTEVPFEAGVSYNFHINLQSYEKIEISTTVTEWEDAPHNPEDDFIIG